MGTVLIVLKTMGTVLIVFSYNACGLKYSAWAFSHAFLDFNNDIAPRSNIKLQ